MRLIGVSIDSSRDFFGRKKRLKCAGGPVVLRGKGAYMNTRFSLLLSTVVIVFLLNGIVGVVGDLVWSVDVAAPMAFWDNICCLTFSLKVNTMSIFEKKIIIIVNDKNPNQ